jgi:hypothetical protein
LALSESLKLVSEVQNALNAMRCFKGKYAPSAAKKYWLIPVKKYAPSAVKTYWLPPVNM